MEPFRTELTAVLPGSMARHCPIPLADGRTFTLDLDELPRPEPEADTR